MAQELANQNKDQEFKFLFTDIAKAFADNEDSIIKELNSIQNHSVELGGYYLPNEEFVN